MINMEIKIFTKEKCVICKQETPKFNNIIKDLKEVIINSYDVETPEGLLEATFYDVLSLPCFLIIKNNNVIKKWHTCPNKNEIINIIGENNNE